MTEFYTRACAFTLRDESVRGDGLTLEGYAAVFNSPTLINDHLGQYEESIAPGAFKRTISARTPVLQFDHGQHPVLGSIPIGSIQSLAEDARGLFVRARLFDNWMTEPLRQAITEGAVDGMSFRFQIPEGKEDWDRSGDVHVRTIREVKLHELGPVVFPAYRDTTVSLRSLAAHVPGLTLTMDGESRSDEEPSSTSEEPAAEARSTSEEPATDTPDPAAASHSVPRDHSYAARQKVRREIEAARRGIAGKKST